MVEKQDTRPVCQDCQLTMTKAGMAYSGKRRVQQYRCPKCRRTTIRVPPDPTGNSPPAKPDQS